MPKKNNVTLDDFRAGELQDDLRKLGFEHLRVRKRGDLLIVESGPVADPSPHARFRRETVNLWRLEMPTHTGRWEVTPFRDLLDRLVQDLVTNFPWTLTPLD